ncbi:receptor-type tyrosine-protein phosphatase epsilon-like [Argopecten irradians]|uniref:receptor-type tyrosine-protein phosphatase epsilon-like n=1 Tax=Argopecten irradians TaxID=31199 RepID=UPI00371A3E40
MKGGALALVGLVLTHVQPGQPLLNWALKQTTTSTDYRRDTNIEYGPSSLVVDGNDSDKLTYNATTAQCLYTIDRQTEAFWQVDLAQEVVLDHVEIIFRRGLDIAEHKRRRNGYSIIVSETSTYLPRTRDNTCYSDTDLSSGFRDNRSCSNIGRYVTIYNERTSLRPPRYSGFAILELCEVKVIGCRITTHGVDCRENCPTNCIDFMCFPGNGTCMRGCRPGYKGDACQDDCDDYFYGHGCADECFCKEGPCNKVFGDCPPGGCQPGYRGQNCNIECERGTFGDNCAESCGSCKSGRSSCHHIDGSCANGCLPGYKVDQCIQVCDAGTYGDSCREPCGSCFQGTPCYHVNGTCLTGCDPGRKGDNCKTNCSRGEYGPNCENTCGMCKQGTDSCIITDGTCPGGCKPGWQGPQCKRVCSPGYYGMMCAEKCGTCRDGLACNHSNGLCEKGCGPGWIGSKCKTQCPATKYGDNCSETCGDCAGENSCNHVDGKCPKVGQPFRCDPGKKGEKCKTGCSNTEYGPDCSLTCGLCFNFSCESVSGNCTKGCLQGWRGVRCVQQLNPSEPTPMPAGTIVGVILGIFLPLILLVAAVYMVKKKRQRKVPDSFKNDENKNQKMGALYVNMAADLKADTDQNVQADTEQNHTNQLTYENVGNIHRSNSIQNGVKTDNLLLEITRKEETKEFEKDFNEFPSGNKFPCEEAMKPENKSRNRWKTTFPYDHSRVTLEGNQNYINANYIRNLDKTNAYVATQGPLAKTLDDFWKMVWQLKTGKIVMLAQCVEKGKNKVEKYWPDSGSTIEHGGVKISAISSENYAAYTVRKFRVVNESTTRVIKQFHFTKWPDHGTPDVMQFVLLLLHVRSTNSNLSGPMIVHCSAGVGRTGTFIALDVLFESGRLTGRVDPPAYVRSLREDRMDMVQKESQYVFIYRALVELFLIDNTYQSAGDFDSKCLKSPRLVQEYKKLNVNRPTISKKDLNDGQTSENQSKNRDQKIIPGRPYRPLLTSHAANKTDYINAVFLPSVQTCNGYLATQWPLPDTVDDFWAMIYDYKSTAIVILDSDDDINDPDLVPSQVDSELTIGNFTVYIKDSTRVEGSLSVVEVFLSKAGDDSSRKIKVFRMCKWPHGQTVCDEGSITQIVYASQGYQKSLSSKGLITVVCRNGSTKCGIFCTVANAIENLNLNQQTSLVQVVRQLQYRRPSFIDSYESYVTCNREVKAHIDSLSEYQNYEGPSAN